jgi:uncharacterized protein
MKIAGTVLTAGMADGPVMILTEPLSFWGAFDPRSGAIVDAHHPQRGAILAGHILLLPETRGSGGTPGGIAEAIRTGTGPLGIILIAPDINLAIGAAVAAELYAKTCPVISVSEAEYAALCESRFIAIERSGMIHTQ